MKNRFNFRAWDKERKLMGYFDLSSICAEGDVIYTNEGNHFNIGMDIMQSTGLEDKNGKEIFEGDVVKYSMYGAIETPQIITRDIWGFNFGKHELSYLVDAYDESNTTDDYIEIVGNIHESPELLKD